MRWVHHFTFLLAATATAAEAQELSLSGTASAGLVYDSDATDSEVSTHSEINFLIAGAGRSDGGLTFGAFLDLDEASVDDAEVFLSGVFGTIRLGRLDAASDRFGILDPGFSGIGIDDVAEQYRNATAGADVEYTWSRGGFTLVATAEIGAERSLGVSAEYATDAFSLGLGYVDDADAANGALSVTAGYSFGPVAVSGLYSDWSAGGRGYGVDLSVDTGPATVTAAWAQATGVEADPEAGVGDAYGIGLSLPLSDGLTLSGGLGRIETDAATDGARTVADFGVTMSF